MKSLQIIFLFTCSFSLFHCQKETKPIVVSEKPIDTAPISSPKKDTISIVAVGDIMIGSEFPSKKYLPEDDGVESFAKVKKYLKGDVVFGNLEGCFLDEGESEKCKYSKPKFDANNEPIVTCYAFRMPTRYGKIIQDGGFTVLSIANNHVGDFGDAGRKKTVEVLEELNIKYAGQIEKPFDIFEVDGVKYGFCAFAPNRNTISINNIPNAKRLVEELKSKVDIVIVSFHGGAEGSKHTRVPKKKELFYGENRSDVHEFAHAVIDAGADVVLGHGPHVTRAVELYKNKLIAYSLGNFNTYGMFNLKGVNGIAPILDIKLNSQGDFLFANVISTQQTQSQGLDIDKDKGAYQQLKTLTELDFPDTKLKFEGNRILIKN